eukprot:scaffold382_cov380-Prasinococcus_capsulatus_cf.AAC.2
MSVSVALCANGHELSPTYTLSTVQVETGALAHSIQCKAPMNSVAWSPKHHLLAFAGDDIDRRDEGCVRVFGFSGQHSANGTK